MVEKIGTGNRKEIKFSEKKWWKNWGREIAIGIEIRGNLRIAIGMPRNRGKTLIRENDHIRSKKGVDAYKVKSSI